MSAEQVESEVIPQETQAPESSQNTPDILEGEQEMVTVFSDPVNFNVKHPLHSQWTMWYDNPGKKANQASWSQNLKEVVTFDTVEDFWGIYNNVVRPSDLSAGSNYHLFKAGIKPMWEDPANAKGGKWVIQFPKKTGEHINTLWLYTMLECIGEGFQYEDEVCGGVVSIRKGFYRISLWTRVSDNKEICESIGKHLKNSLSLNPNQTIEFQSHADAAKSGSCNKDRFTV